jgi:hypothetical protein
MNSYFSYFRYHDADRTYELCKKGRDGLECHVARTDNRNASGQTLTFDRVWGLLLTTEKDRRRGTIDYMLKVIYGGGLNREGLRNEYIAAPMSSVKMKTRFVLEVQADEWPDFILSLEEWASRFNIQLVHDYV